MKYLVYLLVFSILIFSCSPTKNTTNLNRENYAGDLHKDTIRIANDTLKYEIIIIDTGFESWLATQKPMSYYSQKTLEIKNQLYVTEWNQRVLQPNKYNPSLYERQIDYDPFVDYGKEVNYKLYMYFKFFEQKYRQKLL